MQIVKAKDARAGVESWADRVERLWLKVRAQMVTRKLSGMSVGRKLELARKPKISRHTLRVLAADKSEVVRMAVISRPDVPAMWRMAMGKGNSVKIARAWARAAVLSDQEISNLVERWADDPGVGYLLVSREGIGSEVLTEMARRAVDGKVISRLVRGVNRFSETGREVFLILLNRWPSIPDSEELRGVLPDLLKAGREVIDKKIFKDAVCGILRRNPEDSFQVLSNWETDFLTGLDKAAFFEWLGSQGKNVEHEVAGALREMVREAKENNLIQAFRSGQDNRAQR